MTFLQNISYASNVFSHRCCRWSSTSLLITDRLSPFWKRIVPTEHCNTMYSRLIINFLNHFKRFCVIKTGFPAKTNRCTLFNCFFHYDLCYGQNRPVTSHHKYVPHCERFELKLDMCGDDGSLRTFPSFMEIVLLVQCFCSIVAKLIEQTLYFRTKGKCWWNYKF